MDVDFGLRFGTIIPQNTTTTLPQLELPLYQHLNVVQAFFYPPNAFSHYESVSIDLASEVYQDHAKYPANHIRTLELFENDPQLYVVFKYKTTIVARMVIPRDSVNKVFREGKINGVQCTSLYINENSFTCEMWTGTDWAELYSPTLDSTRYILLSDEADILFSYFKYEAGFFEEPESGGTVLQRKPPKYTMSTGTSGSWGSDSVVHDSFNDSDDPGVFEDDHNHFGDNDDGFSRLERSLTHESWDFPSPLSDYSGSSFSSSSFSHNTFRNDTTPDVGSSAAAKHVTDRTNQNRLRVVFNRFRGHVIRGETGGDEENEEEEQQEQQRQHQEAQQETGGASAATATATASPTLSISLEQIKYSSSLPSNQTNNNSSHTSALKTSSTEISSSSSTTTTTTTTMTTTTTNNNNNNNNNNSTLTISKLTHRNYAPILSLLVTPLQEFILNKQLPTFQINGSLLFALKHATTEPEIQRAIKVLEWLKVDYKRRVIDSSAAQKYVKQTPEPQSKKSMNQNKKRQMISVSTNVKHKSPEIISILQWDATLKDVIPSAGEWAEQINLIRFAGYKNGKLERLSKKENIPLETLFEARKAAIKCLAQNANKLKAKTNQQVIRKYRGKHSLGSSCTAKKLKEAQLRVSWAHLATLSEVEEKDLQRKLEKRSTVPRNYVTALKETARVVTSAAVLDLSTPVSS